MKSKNILIQEVIDSFQKLKGRASLYSYDINAAVEIAYRSIKNYAAKRPDKRVFVVVDSYKTRSALNRCIIGTITENGSKLDVTILSEDFIKEKYNYEYDFIITIGINENLPLITKLYNSSRFMMCILTRNIMNYEFINSVRNILPAIDAAGITNAFKEDRIYSPVEESRYGVTLTDEDKSLYDKYTEYITTSISIFGDLSNIEKCKRGDDKLGISSAQYRDIVAKENGWRDDLDTSIPYMKQIDDIYNPNVLFERACNFYNITKKRTDLVTDNDNKLYQILKICEENAGKQILIVSKRGEFAAKITKFINEHACSNIRCGDYHDCIEDAIATDYLGNIIYTKSGVKKGQPKIIGAQAQSTNNERKFNDNIINILSIKSASNPKLTISCDIVIITSPICDNIINFKRRYINITFKGNITKTYKLYCNETIEYNKMMSEKPDNLISIIDNTTNFVNYDENSGDIII